MGRREGEFRIDAIGEHAPQTSRSFARAKALAQDDNVWWLAGKKRREKELENSCQLAGARKSLGRAETTKRIHCPSVPHSGMIYATQTLPSGAKRNSPFCFQLPADLSKQTVYAVLHNQAAEHRIPCLYGEDVQIILLGSYV